MSSVGKVAYHLTRRFRCSFSKTTQFNLIPFVERNCRAYQTHIKLSNLSNSVTKRFFVSENKQVKTMSSLSPLDPSSYSRPELAIIRHISLNLNVNFEEKVLNGSALLQFEILKDVQELVLDASSLSIESVELENGTPLEYTVSPNLPNYGSKLSVNLPSKGNTGENEGSNSKIQTTMNRDVLTEVTPSFQKMALSFDGFMYKVMLPDNSGYRTCLDDCLCSTCYPYLNDKNRIKIKIKYSTAPTASALQWLEPNQTSSKDYPYLFSQCQPIHARSIVPCQDTPAVKFTYDAVVTAPEKFTVLMSAIRGETIANESRFSQPVPIPSYLLAIAVGVLENRRLGPRSLVWAEKEEIEKSAWEFAETENYLKAAERLCGPYVWTQYDLLVLPPSFPYGGMENPCLTFVTPTLLAGDRSQADVIVHEIMHSWTGNLVTNRNFEHFWLNEGFTVFLERKVGASLISNATEAKISRDFNSILGMQELTEAIDYLGSSSPLTNLVVDLKGVHPDDAFSRVPYEKGSLFLRYLEDLVGGPEVFDDFLRAYLVKFQKRSIDTDQFKEFLLDYFKTSDALNEVDWNTWLHGSGMPPTIPNYDATLTKAVQAVLNKNGTRYPDDVANFTPHQMINLLQQFIERPPLPLDTLAEMGKAYSIDNSRNAEIKYRWLRMCLKSKDTSKLKDVFDFVNTQGRMKYVRPIYRDLYEWTDVRTQAIENFLKNEPYMMHVSAYTLRNDLHLNENTDKDN